MTFPQLVALLVVTAVSGIIAAKPLGRFLRLQLYGIRTTAVIIDFVAHRDENDEWTYRPIVQFTVPQVGSVTASSSFTTKSTKGFFRVGQPVDIIYLRHNPQIILLKGYDITWVFLLAGFVLAALLITVYGNFA